MNDYIKEKLALDEIKQIHEHFYSVGDIVDGKALGLLSSSSLILTLFGILQTTFDLSEQSVLYYIGLVLTILLFLALVWLVMKVIAPKKYRLVFEATWDGVEKAVLHQKESDVYYQLIANYLARIQYNKEISIRKSKLLRAITGIFVLIIVLIIILSICSSF